MKILIKTLSITLFLFISLTLSAQEECGFPGDYFDTRFYCCGQEVSDNVCFDIGNLVDNIGEPSVQTPFVLNSIEHTKILDGEINMQFTSFEELAQILTDFVVSNGITAEFNFEEGDNMMCSFNSVQYVNLIFTANNEIFELLPSEGGCAYIFDYEIDPRDLVNNQPDPNDIVVNSPYGDITAGEIMDNWPITNNEGISASQAINLYNTFTQAPELAGCLDIDCFEFPEFNADEFFDQNTIDQINEAIDLGEIEGNLDDIMADIEDGLVDFMANNELGGIINDMFGFGLVSDGMCQGGGIPIPLTSNQASLRNEGSVNERDYFEDENNTTSTSFDTPNAIPSNINDFVSTSVDKFNGKANANISLHSLQSRDLSIPIQLSSSQNGVQVNDPGGSLGKGWNLDELAFVSRNVRGIPDDMNEITLSRGPEMRNKLDIRMNAPSKFGFMFVLGSPSVCGLSECQSPDISSLLDNPKNLLTEGLGGCFDFDTPVLYGNVRFSWTPISPTFLTLSGTLLVKIYPGLWVGIQIAMDIGVAVNEVPILKSRPKQLIGYNNLNDNAVMQQLGLNPMNELTFEQEIQEEEFQRYIFPKRKREENAFLSPTLGSFESIIDILFPLNDPFDVPIPQIDIHQDEYDFRVGSYSGKFKIRMDNVVEFFPPQPGLQCQVQFDDENHISGFEFTTPSGYIYEMGGGANFIDAESNVNYALTNKYVFPENESNNNSSLTNNQIYEQAQLAEERFIHKPFFGKFDHHIGSATYDKNFVINKVPEHNVKWHINTYRSTKTLEQINYEYESIEPFYQVKAKDLNYTFPNFGFRNAGQVRTKKYDGLNPFRLGNTKWQNGQADLTYFYSECKKDKKICSSIITNHNEIVKLHYEENPAIYGDKRLNSISVEQNDNLFKKWNFEYEENIEEEPIEFICEENPDPDNYEPSISVPSEWSFDLGELYESRRFEFRSSFILKAGLPCLYVRTYPPALFRPSIVDEIKITKLTEFGSINDIKDLNKDFIEYNLERDKNIFISENRNSFLKKIYYEGPFEEIPQEEIINIEYLGENPETNEIDLPKRFSLYQDKFGYLNENPNKAPFYEIQFTDIYGALTSNQSQNLSAYFGFKHSNINASPYTGRGVSQELEFKKKGSLKRINYENGSYQAFTYEDNTFNFDNKNYSIGLRVKTLENKPDGSPGLTKTYNYSEPVINILPRNVHTTGVYWIDFNLVNPDRVLEKKITLSTTPVNIVGNVKNALVGFNRVEEIIEEDEIYKVFEYDEISLDPGCNRLNNYTHQYHKRARVLGRSDLEIEQVFENSTLTFPPVSYTHLTLPTILLV